MNANFDGADSPKAKDRAQANVDHWKHSFRIQADYLKSILNSEECKYSPFIEGEIALLESLSC